MGAGDDTFAGIPATAATSSRARTAPTRCCSTAPTSTRSIDISANGERVRFTRDVANITMDLNDVERVDVDALGGADTITVNDLIGTDVTDVNIDLARAPAAAGDGAADTVIVNGTNGDDVVARRRRRDRRRPSLGLAARVNVTGADAGQRPARRSTPLAGDDVVDASGLAADAIPLVAGRRRRRRRPDRRRRQRHAHRRRRRRRPDRRRGADVLDGGPGNNVVLDSAGLNAVKSAKVAGTALGEQERPDRQGQGRALVPRPQAHASEAEAGAAAQARLSPRPRRGRHAAPALSGSRACRAPTAARPRSWRS